VKRAGRILFKAATLLSMLLCLVAIVLWEFGGSSVYSVWRTQGRTVYEVAVANGELGLFLDGRFDANGFVPNPRARWEWRVERSPDLGGDLELIAIASVPNAPRPVNGFFFGGAGSVRVVLVPLSAVAGVLALLPIASFACAIRRLRRQRRRADAGECAACGYDLRATPERCPECGAVRGGGGSAR
jgi:hypothetical protein